MDSVASKVVKLTHKQFRALLKKFRRKKKRQQLAKELEEKELLEQQRRENSPNYKEREEERRRNAQLYEEFEERERIREHKLWLLREAQAQREFQKKQEQLEQEKIKLEEERKRIVAEFEKQQLLESKKEDENQKLKTQKEVIKIEIMFQFAVPKSVLKDIQQDEALQEALSSLPESKGPWHNPIAPENYSTGTERELCQFFVKTGCCRFGERCSRGHIYPSVSTTILIKGMYSHFSIGHTERDDFDTDNVLEYEDKERYDDFRNFYNDVLPEFKKCGKVIQFKVCSNHEPHLRGNVYVQFSKEEEAVKAYQQFNGRFYAGKQLTCEFSHVIKWKSAICGLYFRKLCPKGLNCNFLHVFKNPTNEFWDADRDRLSRDSHSSKSNQSRQRSERKSSHHSYFDESRSYRDSASERRNDYSYQYRSTDSDEDITDNGHYSSSRRKNSDRRRDSSHRSRHKRKYRDSRSRSRSPSPHSDDYSKRNHKRKKSKHKKKSKKRKRQSSSSESEES